MFCQYHISFKIYSDIGNVFYCNEIIKAFNDITIVNQSLFKVGIKTCVWLTWSGQPGPERLYDHIENTSNGTA